MPARHKSNETTKSGQATAEVQLLGDSETRICCSPAPYATCRRLTTDNSHKWRKRPPSLPNWQWDGHHGQRKL